MNMITITYLDQTKPLAKTFNSIQFNSPACYVHTTPKAHAWRDAETETETETEAETETKHARTSPAPPVYKTEENYEKRRDEEREWHKP